MPPFGPNDGENTDVRDGEDSVWRKACGVGGTSLPLFEKDRSNPGVRIVRLAGLRRMPFGGTWIGEGGAERWCWEVVSTTEAVAIGGRDPCDGRGILRERFLRLRARLPGESGRATFWLSVDGFESVVGAAECVWHSALWATGIKVGYDNGMDDGDSGEELGEVSTAEGGSKVDMVVVGDESVEPDVIDDILSRC